MLPADTARFEALIIPHLDAAYTLARYLLRDEHDAQDAVQDAALKAFRYFGSYQGGDPRAWFLAIVRNCSHTWRQRNSVSRPDDSVAEEMALSLQHDSTEADAMAIQHSQQAAITRAVASLPIEFREVIVLREIEDLSYAEISEITGTPIGTVMSRLSRARKRLASILGNEIQEAS